MRRSVRIMFLVIAGVGVWALANVLYAVPPGSEAVVVRFGEVHRTAGPGLNFRTPFLEKPVIYQTIKEQRQEIPGSFEVVGCRAEVELVFSIDDARAFHEAGDHRKNLFALSPRIKAVLSGVYDDAEDPAVDAQLRLQRALASESLAGIRIIRALVDLGECGPQSPQIRLRRAPMPPVTELGLLGSSRVDIRTFDFLTADNDRVEISGAVSTYDVVDPAVFEQCFRSEDEAARRVTSLVLPALRALGHSFESEALSDMAGGLPRYLREMGIDYLYECGVELRSVDYTKATFTRLIEIVCVEASREPECLGQ